MLLCAAWPFLKNVVFENQQRCQNATARRHICTGLRDTHIPQAQVHHPDKSKHVGGSSAPLNFIKTYQNLEVKLASKCFKPVKFHVSPIPRSFPPVAHTARSTNPRRQRLVAEGCLPCAVSAAARRAGNTRHGAAGAPGFRRGVVAGLGLHGIGLPGRMEMEADPCWRALSERLKLHRSGSPKQCLANGPVLRSSILALR